MATVFILMGSQGGPGGPPRPRGPDAANHIADIRRKLVTVKTVDLTARRALAYSRAFLTSAEQSLRSNRFFEANRLAEAADSLVHVAEHQEHLRTGLESKEPPAPPPEAIENHLEQVYFRTQQADFFLSQSHDPRAIALPKWARDFYQLAARDYERHDFFAADENAKSSDDLVNALENLAQAATGRNTRQP